jgi:hypothetical protein
MRKSGIAVTVVVVGGLLAGSAVGVAAQSEGVEPMAPAVVTGSIVESQMVSMGRGTPEEGFVRIEGETHEHVFEASDPRLSGDVTFTGHWQQYPPPVEMEVEAGIYELVNPDGRWVGLATGIAAPDIDVPDTLVFSGEDGYEGLTAYIALDWDTEPATFSGLIFPGAMPAFPEPAAVE